MSIKLLTRDRGKRTDMNSNSTPGGQRVYRISSGAGTVVKVFIILCVCVYAVQFFSGPDVGINLLGQKLGLVPIRVWKNFELWRLVTYIFLHGGFFHLFLNLFIFWMFGNELESFWGSKEFLKYITIGGIGAGLLHVLVSHNSHIPVIGASGVVFALLLAYGLEFPERKIYIYFLFPVKAKYLAIILGAVEIFMILSDRSSNIAHLAHLGGMVFGFFYLKLLKSNKTQTRSSVNIFQKNQSASKTKSVNIMQFYDDETVKRELDRILTKIHFQGKESLTVEEMMLLKEAGRRFGRNFN